MIPYRALMMERLVTYNPLTEIKSGQEKRRERRAKNRI